MPQINLEKRKDKGEIGCRNQDIKFDGLIRGKFTVVRDCENRLVIQCKAASRVASCGLPNSALITAKICRVS